jgi:hypothetical protein
LQNSFTLLAAARDETSFLLFLGSCLIDSESLLLVLEGLDIVDTASKLVPFTMLNKSCVLSAICKADKTVKRVSDLFILKRVHVAVILGTSSVNLKFKFILALWLYRRK